MRRKNTLWTRLVLPLAALAMGSACVTADDPCEGFSCGDGEVCIALENGPRCVCDDYHETQTDESGATVCVSLEEPDAGPADEG